MKKLLTSLLFFYAMLTTGLLYAQNGEMDAQTKAWMAYMTPGNEHKSFAKSAGDWKAVTKLWMDPAKEPMIMESRVKNEMIMGGRYMTSHYTGSMMNMPFEGVSTMGYDNAAKKYVSTWVDNMGTGIMYMEGKWNDNIKGIEFKGVTVDPMTGKDIKTREVFIIKDDNSQVMEMYMEDKGKEMKSMEIMLTRM